MFRPCLSVVICVQRRQWSPERNIIALMRDDVAISLVTSKRGLVVMVSREYLRNI